MLQMQSHQTRGSMFTPALWRVVALCAALGWSSNEPHAHVAKTAEKISAVLPKEIYRQHLFIDLYILVSCVVLWCTVGLWAEWLAVKISRDLCWPFQIAHLK